MQRKLGGSRDDSRPPRLFTERDQADDVLRLNLDAKRAVGAAHYRAAPDPFGCITLQRL